MNNRLLFTAIPNAVIDAYSTAAITPCMFITLIHLYRQADWGTGVVAFTSAGMLAAKMQGQYSARTVQEALQNLHYAGWITSHHRKGSRRNYRLDLGNFTALTGALKDKILNVREIGDWREADDERADYRADDVNFTSTGTSNRNRDETATHQSPQKPSKPTIAQNHIAISAAAGGSAQQKNNPAEQEVLDYWYEHRINRTPDDLPLIRELISVLNGNSCNLLHFVREIGRGGIRKLLILRAYSSTFAKEICSRSSPITKKRIRLE